MKKNSSLENLNFKKKYGDFDDNVHSNKKILFVLHYGSGGTPKTVNDIVHNIDDKFDCYLLTSDANLMRLSYYDGNNFKEIEKTKLYSEWASESVYSDEYYDIYLKY